MKKILLSSFLILIFFISGTTIRAQDNIMLDNSLIIKQLKGLNGQRELSEKTMILNQETIIGNIKSFIENRKDYDASFYRKSMFELAETPSDSGYIYEWKDNWSLKYRSYFTFGSSSIEIIQEKLIQGEDSWNNYSKRVLEYYNSGKLKKETEYFWQNSSTQWLPAYVKENNSYNKNIELYSKIWNDTTEQFTGGYRIASTYLADTLLSVQILQNWEVASNAWKNIARTENTYTNKLITNSEQKIWKETDWISDFSIEYTYSEFGDLLTETSKQWDTIANKWVNVALTDRSYNSLGNVTNIVYKYWNTETSEWVNDLNRIIGYNAQFKVSSRLTQKWDGSAWADISKASLIYDSQGRNTQYLEEIWSSSEWINAYREVYTYASDKITIQINNWNANLSAWENDLLISYFIDGEGYLELEQHDYWNDSLNIYETGYYDKYDNDGNNTEYFEKMWDDSLKQFTEGTRILSTYSSGKNKKIKESVIQEWDTLVSDWKNLQKTVYFWAQDVFIKVPASLLGLFKIYPVPFTDIINVEIYFDMVFPPVLKFIDLEGRVLFEYELIDNRSTIDLSHLNKGTYMVELNSKQGRAIIKVIKY